jgi:hypothetical protein
MSMPAFLGGVQILNASGTDSAFLSPKTAGMTSNGAGDGNSGAFVTSSSAVSTNNAIDTSIAEQPITGNN